MPKSIFLKNIFTGILELPSWKHMKNFDGSSCTWKCILIIGPVNTFFILWCCYGCMKRGMSPKSCVAMDWTWWITIQKHNFIHWFDWNWLIVYWENILWHFLCFPRSFEQIVFIVIRLNANKLITSCFSMNPSQMTFRHLDCRLNSVFFSLS